MLHPRFQVAIDKAASRAGKRAYNDYIEEWRKAQRRCGDDLEAEVAAEAERLEAEYDKHRLAQLIQTGGVEGGRASRRPTTRRQGRGTEEPRPHDPTPSSARRPARSSSATTGRSSIIGERINPTGRKLLAEEMKAGDFSRVERDAIAQVEAGAHMLDVNAGIPLADEPAILARTIQLVQSLADVPLSIDSSIVEALEAGLAVYQGKALRQLRDRRGGAPRARPAARQEVRRARSSRSRNDETGISEDPDVRFAVAKRIVERAADHGIPREDVIVDPLLMPIGALPTAGRQVFRILGRLRDELSVNSTCGASQRQLRAAQPRGDQRRVPADGDRQSGLTSRDHEPASPRASGTRSWPPTC